MCKQLGISHAAYYKWLHRTIPEQESENTKLAELIKEYNKWLWAEKIMQLVTFLFFLL